MNKLWTILLISLAVNAQINYSENQKSSVNSQKNGRYPKELEQEFLPHKPTQNLKEDIAPGNQNSSTNSEKKRSIPKELEKELRTFKPTQDKNKSQAPEDFVDFNPEESKPKATNVMNSKNDSTAIKCRPLDPTQSQPSGPSAGELNGHPKSNEKKNSCEGSSSSECLMKEKKVKSCSKDEKTGGCSLDDVKVIEPEKVVEKKETEIKPPTDTAIAIDTETKKEDVEATSIVKFISSKLESKKTTITIIQDNNKEVADVTIYLNSIQEITQLYSIEEMSHLGPDAIESKKEATFVSLCGKILSESDPDRFGKHEMIITLKVESSETTINSQDSGQFEINHSSNSIETQISVPPSGEDKKPIQDIPSKSISHRVAIVSTKSEARKVDKRVNYIDVNDPQYDIAVAFLFQQINQSIESLHNDVIKFIKTMQNQRDAKREVITLADNIRDECTEVKDNEIVIIDQKFEVFSKSVYFYSSFTSLEVTSTKEAKQKGVEVYSPDKATKIDQSIQYDKNKLADLKEKSSKP